MASESKAVIEIAALNDNLMQIYITGLQSTKAAIIAALLPDEALPGALPLQIENPVTAHRQPGKPQSQRILSAGQYAKKAKKGKK
jgi:hypothetical protein